MSRSPDVGVDATIGLVVGEREPVDLSVVRDGGGADLVIGGGVAEIRLRRAHLVAIRDQLPGVLAELDLLDAADERVEAAGSQAVHMASNLLDAAFVAERAGEHERAAQMREKSKLLAAAANALDHALQAVETAGSATDEAALDARHLLAKRKPDQQPAQDQPADPA